MAAYYFFIGNSHRVLDIGKNSWLNKVTDGANPLTACDQTSSLLHTYFNVLKHFVELGIFGDGAMSVGLAELVANHFALGYLLYLLYETLVHRLVDEEARWGDAALAHVGEHWDGCFVRRLFHFKSQQN